ncbi:single-strand DNA-binding protein, partial [Phenoliferia sp. Uapishka_3]
MLSALRPSVSRVAARAFSTSRTTADYAKISLIGRIGSDPVIKTNKNGKEFLVYKVATSDPYVPAKDGGAEPEQTTSWHTIFAYGPSVEKLSNLEKGTLVHVEASFRTVSEKTESGEYTTNIFANHGSSLLADLVWCPRQDRADLLNYGKLAERLHTIRKPYKPTDAEATEE